MVLVVVVGIKSGVISGHLFAGIRFYESVVRSIPHLNKATIWIRIERLLLSDPCLDMLFGFSG